MVYFSGFYDDGHDRKPTSPFDFFAKLIDWLNAYQGHAIC